MLHGHNHATPRAQLEDTRPGAAYLQSLAAAVDAAEGRIAAAKAAQVATYAALVAEQQRLEEEVADLAGDAAAEPVAGPAAGAGTREGGAAAGGAAPRGLRPAPHGAGAPAAASGSASASTSGGGGGGGGLPEAAAYDALLAAGGGPTGGWHAADHAAWLRLLRRCRGNAARAVLAAGDELPGFSRAQVGAAVGRPGAQPAGGRGRRACRRRPRPMPGMSKRQ